MKSLKYIFIEQQKNYKIPFYQRNFAWREEQIHQLLTDIYDSFTKSPNQNYYIGTLVTIKHNEEYEVIDGQQRLTALSLILKYLGFVTQLKLNYDARPKVLEFLKAYYENGRILNEPDEFVNAIDAIKSWKHDKGIKDSTQNDGKYITIDSLNDDEFKEYILNKIQIIHNIMPEKTDVESYFEIMNNRGEQLKNHEILKAKLLSILPENYRKNAATIWDACSQMDKVIQKIFGKEHRIKLFSESYDQLCSLEEFKVFLCISEDTQQITNTNNDIASILDQNEITESNPPEAEEIVDENNHSQTIIDFPNFLMHVFNVFQKTTSKDDKISLNDKNLLDTDIWNSIFPENMTEGEKQEQATTLIYKIFHCRTFFDRYIVRTKEQDNDLKWSLQKPKLNKEGTLYFVNTFGQEDSIDVTQDQIIKALSMLQVSYSSRVYKNWLLNILECFCSNKWINISIDKYLSCLHKIIDARYQEIQKDTELLSRGTSTPRFLFFFIDYLYYVAKLNNMEEFKEIEHVDTNFEFRYYNSIEHHLARQYNNDRADSIDKIDSIGNLLITSSSENSRLSDRDVREKITRNTRNNYPPKQSIIYESCTKLNYTWGKEQIEAHQQQTETILNQYQEILQIKKAT